MVKQLSGRALDLAAAAAMGCSGYRLTEVGAHLEAMLVYLESTGLHVEMQTWAKGNNGKRGASAVLVGEMGWDSQYVEGATLNEAIARLVVAVAGDKKEPKP